ncbi:mandelate racemase/muconate lactonizing enzyme family protein [bacterium]|nr:mandelate racemase/muconate lactonizing enzyme family protein [bacterium]
MKITGVRTRRINIPFDRPIGTAIHHIEGVAGLLVWVDTDEGITGESYLWVMGAHRLPVLEAMVDCLAAGRIGQDPRDVGRQFDQMWSEINFLGVKGVTLFGLAALDWACWDILGKSLGASVSRLLGRRRDRVRAYASGGLWANRTLEELHDEAKAFLAQGFTAMKVRVGRPDAGEDAERVAAVRSAIGWKVALMADVNQGLSVDDAIRLGRKLEPYGLTWLEEPVQLHDLEGCARVAAEVDIPIASGENEYGRYGFRDMLERKSATILMPDLERVGGVTEFHRVAEMAAAHDIQVSPHLFTEHSLQLCASAPTCRWAEHMPWFQDLFVEPLEMRDGDLIIPDRPGLGFTFDPDAVERFAI